MQAAIEAAKRYGVPEEELNKVTGLAEVADLREKYKAIKIREQVDAVRKAAGLPTLRDAEMHGARKTRGS